MEFDPSGSDHEYVMRQLVELRLSQLRKIAVLCGRLTAGQGEAIATLLAAAEQMPDTGKVTLQRDPFFHASFTSLVNALRTGTKSAAEVSLYRLVNSLLVPAGEVLSMPVQLPCRTGGRFSFGLSAAPLRLGPDFDGEPVTFTSVGGRLHWHTNNGRAGAVKSLSGSATPVLDGSDDRLPTMLSELASDLDSFSTERVDPVNSTISMQEQYAEALARLRVRWPAMFAEITANVGIVVPIAASKTAAFSNTAWHGGIFLHQDFSDPVFLIERIVHEASHLRLNAVMTRQPMHHHSWEHRIESPFRTGLRPVNGLLHGAFVFSRASAALIRCFGRTASADLAAAQARALLDRVAVALPTIRADVSLTDEGDRLVTSLEAATGALYEQCGDAAPAAATAYLKGEM